MRANRIVSASLLFLSGTVAAAAEPAPQYEIDPCSTPVRVHVFGLPSQPPPIVEFETCGTEREKNLADFDVTTFVGDQAALDAFFARGALLDLSHDAVGFDLHLRLPQDGAVLRYEALDLSLGAARVVLKRIGHDAGPELAATLEAYAPPQPLVGVHVVDANLQQVARDVARLKRLELRNIERVDPTLKGTFHLSPIPAIAVLSLVADTAELSFTRDASSAFVFGAVKDYAAIMAQQNRLFALQDDPAALRAALETMIELAQPNDAEDAPLDMSDAMSQLVELAKARDDTAQAEHWQQRLVAEADHFSGADSLAAARARAGLGGLRLKAQDANAARPLLEAAFGGFEQHVTAATLEKAPDLALEALNLWRDLSVARAAMGDFVAAQASWQRALDMRRARLGEQHARVAAAHGDLALLQRCAGQDKAAIANERRAAHRDREDAMPKVADDDWDAQNVLAEMRWNLSQALFSAVLPTWKAALDAPGDASAIGRRECVAELLAVEVSPAAAASEYQSALAARIALQGRGHAATRRSAQRALDLAGDDAQMRDHIHRMLGEN